MIKDHTMASKTTRSYAHHTLSLHDALPIAFRQALRSDPRGAVEKTLGSKLPAGLQVKLVEETADTFYLVLPANLDRAPAGQLSDQQLDAVAGGWTDLTACAGTCAANNCTGNTCQTCDDTCG